MKIRKYMVSPSVPDELSPLLDITRNFWWCWNQKAIDLLRRIESSQWDQRDHNPIKVLGETSESNFDRIINDDAMMMQLREVHEDFRLYMSQESWYNMLDDDSKAANCKIAYFSFEYGLHESLPNYSGGLGILSGDHLKSASDLGLPLVAVGLLYRKGYFRQYLNVDGWQQEYDIENDFYNLALEPVLNETGDPVKISVDMPGRKVHAQIWKANVGRVMIYYLDANIEENSPEDRNITAQLYGGDIINRIEQEILLGIGGIRALHLLGIRPTVHHMNEGHSAFLSLERLRMLMEAYDLDRDSAMQIIYASNVFTTHTPVPAGNDVFSADLIDKYFKDYIKSIHMSMDEFLKLGRINEDDKTENFCMTVLALKCSARSNGVSELHGHVSRTMWKNIWKDIPENELPIGHITNGIHIMSWISFEMQQLFDRYLGPRWKTKPLDSSIWERVERIPDAELWRTHERRKERLIGFARQRLSSQLQSRGYPKTEVEYADQILDPDALTIGFARRFATYKRGTLVFKDIERLKKILNNKERPVQIIFAGKSHPQDNGGKDIIREIIELSRIPEFRDKIVFLEDYDINVARYLVQGVDVWLNNPRRPLEASGTSGMKVPPNGGLNFSILDGWWDEAYDGQNGFTIGKREEYTDTVYQDEVESKALYNTLEKEIVPLYYNRGRDGIPRGWISAMKWAMQTLCPEYSTNRMVADYLNKYYTPATEAYENLVDKGFEKAKKLKEWKHQITKDWSHVHIENIISDMKEDKLLIGTDIDIKCIIHLGGIDFESVKVEIYYGKLDMSENLIEPETIEMRHSRDLGEGKHSFVGALKCTDSGQNGFVVRVYPYHEDLSYKFEMKLICWS